MMNGTRPYKSANCYKHITPTGLTALAILPERFYAYSQTEMGSIQLSREVPVGGGRMMYRDRSGFIRFAVPNETFPKSPRPPLQGGEMGFA
jgi:hypothetical protein